MHSSICSLTPLQIILSSFFGSIRRKYCGVHPTHMSSLDVGDIQIRKRLDLICPNASLCPNSCWTWGSHWKYKTPVWNNSAVMEIPKDIISAVGFHSLYMRILLVGMFLWQSIILSSPKNTTFFLPTKSFLQAVEGHFASCFSSAGLLYVGFSACMFGLYSFMPVVIKKNQCYCRQPLPTHSWPVQPLLWIIPLPLQGMWKSEMYLGNSSLPEETLMQNKETKEASRLC